MGNIEVSIEMGGHVSQCYDVYANEHNPAQMLVCMHIIDVSTDSYLGQIGSDQGKLPVILRKQASVYAHYVTSCTQYDTSTQASIHAHLILKCIGP